MELFEQIRLGYADGETIQGLAEKHGIHRRTVRQAISSAVPPDRKKAEREQPKLGAVREHIDRMSGGHCLGVLVKRSEQLVVIEAGGDCRIKQGGKHISLSLVMVPGLKGGNWKLETLIVVYGVVR